MSRTIAISYLYNLNGMGTWAIEAAKALSRHSFRIILIKDPRLNVTVEGIECIDYAPPEVDFLGRFSERVLRAICLFTPAGLRRRHLPEVHSLLNERGIFPDVYLLNQSDLFSDRVDVAQYVVAWAYPPDFKSYVRRAYIHSHGKIEAYLKHLRLGVYWYKSDWFAYRKAAGILAVTKSLCESLLALGCNAALVHPGTSRLAVTMDQHVHGKQMDQTKINVAVSCRNIDDPRKNIRWILDCLSELSRDRRVLMTLHVFGAVSEDTRHEFSKREIDVRFYGLLEREAMISAVSRCDIFLFASKLEDWGFVQIESMGQGLAVLAPNQSPCDEIVGREDFLFRPGDRADLKTKLARLSTERSLAAAKDWFQERYELLFSSAVFGEQLLIAINSTNDLDIVRHDQRITTDAAPCSPSASSPSFPLPSMQLGVPKKP